ncbi:bifunctional homocysteine S-methyltransferase/methylenetetrahydrofolate reductase [Sporosarcina sp. ANT_H38]|uniref:bifunctional homocysteine S-methyltransferase/methylenetetrahydrofolate reductase n=1 Tax=Sporosarcina sp. ANT_H38 TaxID=2597358 RepID=UPI0011F1D125|nr:bifunctional homocysteine S-methyltransferase/methylenetetrahydrofolate reductase [Sporosarcina sp. ANT_H38]KAA0941695.1 bifunctional homocysteine S-methyltransferase/methylenetetrahydrofolate reductase [Sporosarcina sp. ANT_H38]
MNLLETMKERILIGDGAMGTLLYSHGVDLCFEEMNLTHPDQVLHIHQAYIEAGADIIQTNTYGANYIKLARYGLEDSVKKINKAAVQLAKKAAGKNTFILGTIGGIHGSRTSIGTKEEIKRSFREQLYCLLLEGVDGLLLETYYDFDELTTVLKIAREETDIPIITNVSMHEAGVLQNGLELADALQQLEELGADIVGVNCRLGPHHMLESLETVPLMKRALLSVYPNASYPGYKDGKLFYENEPEYFERFAMNFRREGASLIGGCCGTTPEHIRALVKGLTNREPIQEKFVEKKEAEVEIIESTPTESKLPTLLETVKKRHSIIVELDAPKHLNTSQFFEGAQALKDAGVDAITLADNSLATPRICNASMASLVKQNIGATPLVHITCRDRNLIGLQSHLMGLHTLGITELLAITGDPTKIGEFPGATSVFDMTSFELIQLIKQFNEGISKSGKSLQQKTSFTVAAAFNPNVRHLDRAVERLEKKIEAGADYFITQPIYSTEKIIEVYEATKHIEAPIYIGIMPLTSSQNAEFLHNEVPGIKLTDQVRARMALSDGNREQSTREGLEVSKELIDVALEHFHGIYLITPFMRYDMTVHLTEYIHSKVDAIVAGEVVRTESIVY